MKKTWQVPKLIVLVRSKPEEVVLSACKSAITTGSPTVHDNQCDQAGGCGLCIDMIHS